MTGVDEVDPSHDAASPADVAQGGAVVGNAVVDGAPIGPPSNEGARPEEPTAASSAGSSEPEPVAETAGTRRGPIGRWIDEWRPSAITLGAPVYPLIVLFGLNAVDELDRSAFALLLPDIRDHFGMSDSGALTLVSLTTIAILAIEVPLSFYCDRANRVRIATVGAAIWGLFSIGTGAATSIAILSIARVGAGGGRAVVTPTHSSLISDYYEPNARVKVFSAHRQANSVGMVLGPLLGGALALWLGWRAPFFVFAVPTLIFVILAMRLKEPVRGRFERLAAGADATAADEEDAPLRAWDSMKLLHSVKTIRRIWWSMPFLAIAIFGVMVLLALIYEDVYGLNSAERGVIAAAVEPLQVVGVFMAMPWVAKIAMRDPGFLLRYVAIVGIVDGTLLVVLAYAPNLATAVVMHALLAGSIGTLVPAFFALVSLVAPPRARAAAFSTMSVFAIPGIAIFLPVIGYVSDELGVQASMVVLVPIAVIAGFVLASASKFVMPDIAQAYQPVPRPDPAST